MFEKISITFDCLENTFENGKKINLNINRAMSKWILRKKRTLWDFVFLEINFSKALKKIV